jgi:hypothetical protein
MSGQEAGRQLGDSRREIEDSHDSFFADAIDQAENDLTMAEWWLEQRALDKILSRNGVNSPCRRPCEARYPSVARNIRPPLYKRTTATRAAASGAAEAMIGSHDLAAFERAGMDIPQEEAVTPSHSELLVEIAIIDFAVPADAEGVATHEAVNRLGIKCLEQQLPVSVQFSAVPEPGGEPADGHVGDRVKAMEIDTEMAFQFPFVAGLELELIRRKEGAS